MMNNNEMRTSQASGTSVYGWSRVGREFDRRYAEGPDFALAFCRHWIDQLQAVLKTTTQSLEVAEANSTLRSLELLHEWWIPSRSSNDAVEAGRSLRHLIVKEFGLHAYTFERLREPPYAEQFGPEYLAAFRERSTAIAELTNEAELIGRIAGRLLDYDPRTSTESPDDVLSRVVLAGLNERLADRLPPVTIGTDPETTKASWIRARLALPDDDPAKARVLSEIRSMPAHSGILLALYAPGGSYKMAREQFGIGKAFDSRRDKALEALSARLPELAVLPRVRPPADGPAGSS